MSHTRSRSRCKSAEPRVRRVQPPSSRRGRNGRNVERGLAGSKQRIASNKSVAQNTRHGQGAQHAVAAKRGQHTPANPTFASGKRKQQMASQNLHGRAKASQEEHKSQASPSSHSAEGCASDGSAGSITPRDKSAKEIKKEEEKGKGKGKDLRGGEWVKDVRVSQPTT